MKIGFHLPVAGGLVKAAEQAQRLGTDCLQIFAGNPRSWTQKPLDPELAAGFRRACRRAGLRPVTVHAHYLINLASPDDELWQRSHAALAGQLIRAAALGAAAVVVHPGSRGRRDLAWGLERVAAGVGLALDAAREQAGDKVQVWLENTAGGGGHLGGALGQLALLMGLLQGRRVGVCLDTAHALAAGYRLDRPGGASAFLDRVDRLLGLRRVRFWHLNDTLHPRGSRRDEHTHLGRGRLGAECFAGLLADPRLERSAGVMETPKDSAWADRRNLAFMRRLERQIRNLPQRLTPLGGCANFQAS
ncbi:MAG: deoxyribonuclease IV [Pseudomonadota bacterium]